MTHNHLVPGSSPGGTTKKPSMSLTMRVLFFFDTGVEPIIEPKMNFLIDRNQKKFETKFLKDYFYIYVNP